MSGSLGTIASVLFGINVGQPIQAGIDAKKAADFNATILNQRAQVARDQGNANEEANRRRTAIALGKEAAGMADSTGLSGTNADVFKQSATDAELDALNIRYGATLSGMSADEQAAIERMRGKNAYKQGFINAGAAALSAYGGYASAGARANTGTGLS